MKDIFILCSEHIFVGFIQNMVVLIKTKTNKKWFSLPGDIEHPAMCQMCRQDSIASTVMSYPLQNSVYDVTSLALLSHQHIRHMA